MKYGIYKTLYGVWDNELCSSSDSLVNLQRDVEWLRDNNPGVKYEILECLIMAYPINREASN